MFQLTIQETELFNSETNEFIYIDKPIVLQLEHSLVSLSKWEAIWKKPFLSTTDKTRKEIISYIKCMTITQNVNPDAYYAISDQQIKEIWNYVGENQTATTFTNRNKGRGDRHIITSEIIYYWMSIYNIPFDVCQKWHLSRLLTLIKVCDEKSSKQQKMPRKEQMSQQAALNAARRNRMNSLG